MAKTISGTWLLNYWIYDVPTFNQQVNFTSNRRSFTSMIASIGDTDGMLYYNAQAVGHDWVHQGNVIWYNKAFRLVDFGATEQSVDDTFGNWFIANAVQLNVTDLTNTIWTVNAGWTTTTTGGKFSISGVMNCFTSVPTHITARKISMLGIGYNLRTSTTVKNYVSGSNNFGVAIYGMNSNIILAFTGGRDATNPDPIAWLTKYGVQMQAQTLTVINRNDETETATFAMPYGYTWDDFAGSEYDADNEFEITGSDAVLYKGYRFFNGFSPAVDIASGTYYYDGESREEEIELTTLTLHYADTFGNAIPYVTYNVPVGMTFAELAVSEEYDPDDVFTLVDNADSQRAVYKNGVMIVSVDDRVSPVSTFTYASKVANDTYEGVIYTVFTEYKPEETPTATFDLSTLGLGVGTHEITVRAKASGYADSTKSNALNYFSEGETYELSGTWVFNETLTFTEGLTVSEDVTFSSYTNSTDGVDTNFKKLVFVDNGNYFDVRYVSNSHGRAIIVYQSVGSGWTSFATDETKVLDFGSKPQSVSKEFYDWFVSNAQPALSGTWVFNSTPKNPLVEIWQRNIVFTVPSHPTEGNYVCRELRIFAVPKKRIAVGDGSTLNADLYEGYGGGWTEGYNREIVFDGTQTVSKEFYDWFIANAKRLILFNIVDYSIGIPVATTHQALNDMSWEKWIVSEYNDGNYVLNVGSYAVCFGEEYSVYLDTDLQLGDEKIIEGANYKLGDYVTGGGGNND